MSSAQELLDIARANAPLLLPTIGYAAAWLALRFVFYTIIRANWKHKGIKDAGVVEKILEEAYAIIGSVVAFALGLRALQHSDGGGCGLGSTLACFSGWPSAPGGRHPSVALYHNVELGWYMHYLAKHPLGIGIEDNMQMHIHHASTIALLLISFGLNLHRIGVLVLLILNMSNPFLHVVKVLHYLDATLLESWRVHPGFLDPATHLPVYLAANLLLGLLMVLQVQWFGGIVRVLSKALRGSTKEFRQESQAQDYAKKKDE
ncbi:hypothetical protein GPECTOR_8g315 [Gonium pectorale]|uniref:TLC domain-containing protein n=1 Tax=Gonium pectorale TaxID=33097 RepID=A0A150GUC3_GONPE|nr:hypothetical protein GPECTOR_8g315 [Gonium pectorale]|eukprot:KXZ52940.1 hypothetical protein GPECTOR_8g315 [Gonium pectorale]